MLLLLALAVVVYGGAGVLRVLRKIYHLILRSMRERWPSVGIRRLRLFVITGGEADRGVIARRHSILFICCIAGCEPRRLFAGLSLAAETTLAIGRLDAEIRQG